MSLSVDNGSPSRENVSFKFTKRASMKLGENKLNDAVSNLKKDYVQSVSGKEIKSSIKVEKSAPLVIPMIKKNNWRLVQNSNEEETEESRLKNLAIKELLKETAEENEKWEKREFNNYTISIPLIMQNKIPEGYETDDKMDVSLRPDESRLADYEKVPVEQYGMAMLRGMGWKEGEPIGAGNKKLVEPIQVQLRPKGLGLGADASSKKKDNKDPKSKEEKLELVTGSYGKILQGTQKGHYGQVLGLDEENGRAIIKLSVIDQTITVPEFYISVISKKEFDKESRVINRTSYEKYKKVHKETEARKSRSVEENDRHSKEKYPSETSKREKYSGLGSPDRKQSSSSLKRKHGDEKSAKKYSKNESVRPWVMPQLRVRFIDEKYKKGKYFNEKLIVIDVLSPTSCVCKTTDDRYLEDISPSMLETVIPRSEPGYVMIVSGKHAGEVCTILKRDKANCVATVQLLSDRHKALKLDYDLICEYVGDISQLE